MAAPTFTPPPARAAEPTAAAVRQRGGLGRLLEVLGAERGPHRWLRVWPWAARVQPTALARYRAWRWMLAPLGIGLASRAAVLAVSFAAVWLLPANPSFPRLASRWSTTLQSWHSWDAAWYSSIALQGYAGSGSRAPSVAFWPLLPILERLLATGPLAWLLPAMDRPQRVAWAGMLLVFLAFLAALVVFYRLVLVDHPPDVARRATLYLAFAPGALFYTAAYPDALLLLGVAGCLLALRQGRWAAAGLAGGVAAAAQVPGSLLLLPFLWTYVERERRVGWQLLWAVLIPLGPALWLGFLWLSVGDPLAPLHTASQVWHHRGAWPWDSLLRAARLILSEPNRYVLVAVNLAFALAALAASAWTLLRGPRSWGLWGLAVTVLYLSLPPTEPLEGFLRYSLAILPVWLLTARLVRTAAAETATAACLAMLQGFLVALFVSSYWVA